MITLTCTRRAGRKKTQYHRLGRLGFLGPVDDGPEDVVELGDDVVGDGAVAGGDGERHESVAFGSDSLGEGFV